MSFNGFSLNVVLESLKFRTKGGIRNHSAQLLIHLIKPSTAGFVDFPYTREMKLAKLWLQLGASKHRISTSNAVVEALKRRQVLEKSSDLSCRKLQDCLYLIAVALFSPAMTDNVPRVSKEGCRTAACKHGII